MKELTYTLLSDGSSDSALLPILDWSLREHLGECAIRHSWADLRRLHKPPRLLVERIQVTLQFYPCDLLFVHRDAEKQPFSARVREITRARNQVEKSRNIPPIICVIPVRMQEAWLLFDEKAIRTAAANPNGRELLQLPHLHEVEDLPDPKAILHDLIRAASGLSGRRREKIAVRSHAHRVAELILDFSPLRAVAAFQALEADIERIVNEQGWNT